METNNGLQDQSGRKECERAKWDYKQAETAYNAAKATRETRNNETFAAGIGVLGDGPGALLMGLFANTTRNDANTAQYDMNHALLQMQDAATNLKRDTFHGSII